MKRTLSWYWHRARAMSPGEMLHRARLVLLRPIGGRTGMPDLSRLPREPVKLPIDPALIEEAEAYLRHEWRFFGLTGLREEPIDWHVDPTGAGNIKMTWEKSRHHHLTVLAQAYALTKDERFSAEVADQLGNWIACNPFPTGVNWSQPLEAGIRLIAWVWCERWLRGSAHYDRAFGPASPVWGSAYRHQRFIRRAYARGSSANNHLIGEMAGLFIAASAWPVFAESGAWREFARESLEREIVRQTFPSGLNREMAFAYHLFTLEFFLLALREGSFSESYRDRVAKMRAAIPALTDAGGNLPRYGDDDDGLVLQLQPRAGQRWFVRDLPPPPAGPVAFEDAGLYVLRSSPGILVIADAGPHGYLSIAAHAHADALAFTLSVGGKPILIDPGTYVYHTDRQWRDYFRSTSAHNTVVVDDLNQSTMAGPFLWTQRAVTTTHEWTGTKLVASHDGYQRIGVIHRRALTLDGNVLTIEDSLQGTGTHRVTVCYHTAPECRVEGNVICRDDVRMHLKLPDTFDVAQVSGWYSPQFGVKQESITLLARKTVTLPATFTTVVEIRHG